ncbi:hypothetical protein RUND412_002396 [Rhizina undulata]
MAASNPTDTFLLLLLVFLASCALLFLDNFETVVDFFIFAVNTSATAFVSYMAWILTISVTENGALSIFTALLIFFGWGYVPWIIFSILLCSPLVVGVTLVYKTAKKVGKETAFIDDFLRLITTSKTAVLNILSSILHFFRSVVEFFQRDLLSDTRRPPVPLTSSTPNNYPTSTTEKSSTPPLQSNINHRAFVDYRLNERYFGQNKLAKILNYDPADLTEEDRRRRIRIRNEIAEDDRQILAQIQKKVQDELFWAECEARLKREAKWIEARTADYQAQTIKSPWPIQKAAPITTEVNTVRTPQIGMETQESPVIFNPAAQKEILRAQKRAARGR